MIKRQSPEVGEATGPREDLTQLFRYMNMMSNCLFIPVDECCPSLAQRSLCLWWVTVKAGTDRMLRIRVELSPKCDIHVTL